MVRIAEQKYTKTGRRKRASYEMVANWVSKAWSKIQPELIISSFIGCGLSSERTNTKLNPNLRDLLDSQTMTYTEDPSGLTDDEDDEDIISDSE